MTEKVNHPQHYNNHPSGVECITIVEWFNFNLGNAIKYVWRAGHKSNDPQEDLMKAKWYIERELARLQSNNEKSLDEILDGRSLADPTVWKDL